MSQLSTAVCHDYAEHVIRWFQLSLWLHHRESPYQVTMESLVNLQDQLGSPKVIRLSDALVLQLCLDYDKHVMC